MATPIVVTISREFGSGGARIGREVARRLGYRYADREILTEAAKRLEAEADNIQSMEERVRSFWERHGETFFKGGVDSPYVPPPFPILSPLVLFEAEREIIRAMAAVGNAVIVGRGAAHVLGDRSNVVRVFLHAPMETRVRLAIEEYKLPDEVAAMSTVRKIDEQRAEFVRRITGRNWSDATLYDVSLNTALTGLDTAVDLIVDLVGRHAVIHS
jgi:CMP/dCMP kinase